MDREKTFLNRFDAALTCFEEWVLITGVSVMGVVMALQVFFRSVLQTPLYWSEELARHVFIWTVFVGLSYGVSKGLHVKFDYFLIKMPLNIRKPVLIACDILILVTCLYMYVQSFVYVQDQMAIKAASMPYPMGIVMAALPVSLTLTIIRTVQDIWRCFRLKQEVAA